MKSQKFILLLLCTVCAVYVFGQEIKLKEDRIQNVQVSASFERIAGRRALKVIKDKSVEAVDEPTFVKISDIEFGNGTIEVDVLSRILPEAPALSRGFIGLAFRIDKNNSAFEGIYLRPANAKASDTLRRSHTVQYFSYPDYKFDRSRKETPGKYEGYADIDLNKWIKVKIIVLNGQAMLFVNGSKIPVLTVNDLKLGPNRSGAIGLWVDVGTEGYFSNLKITKNG